jgi:uncharacterized membrane protein
MEKLNPARKLAHIISRHSNWTADGVTRFYNTASVYAGRDNWIKFLKVALLAAGMAFCSAGVFFFFAYNWAEMHPFAKLGILQGVIMILVLASIVIKSKLFVKQILLIAASLMAGALFAVFGQIYQTGADAYDFFLGWTIFIAIWVLTADFAALWLVFIGLINTTILTFFDQDDDTWSLIARCNILFAVNMFATISLIYFGQVIKVIRNKPNWLVQIISLAAVTSLTFSIIDSIFDSQHLHTGIAVICLVIFYPAAISYGILTKSVFWIGMICFSLIAITSAVLTKPFDEAAGIFLFIAAFIVGSTTLLIYQLLKLKKKWSNEN